MTEKEREGAIDWEEVRERVQKQMQDDASKGIKPFSQRAIEMREQVLKPLYMKNPFGVFFSCGYDERGAIILNGEERKKGFFLEVFCENVFEGLRNPFISIEEYDEADELFRELDPDNEHDSWYALDGKFFMYSDGTFMGVAYKSMNPDPKRKTEYRNIQAMHSLCYLVERYNDLDFWVNLEQYRYFALQDGEPKFLKE